MLETLCKDTKEMDETSLYEQNVNNKLSNWKLMVSFRSIVSGKSDISLLRCCWIFLVSIFLYCHFNCIYDDIWMFHLKKRVLLYKKVKQEQDFGRFLLLRFSDSTTHCVSGSTICRMNEWKWMWGICFKALILKSFCAPFSRGRYVGEDGSKYSTLNNLWYILLVQYFVPKS